jgi:hypothetical protein
MQQQLVEAGFQIKVDGKWGEKTQAAFEAWRKQQVEKDAVNAPLAELTPKSATKVIVSPPANQNLALSDYKTRQGNYKSGGKVDKKTDDGGLDGKIPTKLTSTAKPTADSTKYYSNKVKADIEEHLSAKSAEDKALAAKKFKQNNSNLQRQANKGKSGFNKDGFPLANKKLGGKIDLLEILSIWKNQK